MQQNYAASPYVREKPSISYVEPGDAWLTQHLIGSIETLFGRKTIESIYQDLKSKPFELKSFFSDALAMAKIKTDYDHKQLKKIPQKGPLVFIANHPFGIVDGLILCDLALKVRDEFQVLLHSLLCQDKDLAPYFLPVDFNETREAAKTNITSKKQAQRFLKQGVPVLIFPSGMVSTANQFGLGPVKDGPWSTFASKLIRDSNATVVPVYFHGQNSRKFHIASHIAEPLRMALLVHEAVNKFNTTIQLSIGNPIHWSEMEPIETRQALTDFLYQKVQNTALERQ